VEIRNLDVPRAWEKVDFQVLRGTILVIGAPDAGKSTFAYYLYRRLTEEGRKAAYLDGDPGQSMLGPPAVLSTVYPGSPGATTNPDDGEFPPPGKYWRSFVGGVTPAGRMLAMLVSGFRLATAVQRAGAEVVVYDTCGLVDPNAGGVALKMAKIDLLQPSLVFAIQRGSELQPLLAPLRRSGRAKVEILEPSPAVRRRPKEARQAHRAAHFRKYFSGAGLLQVDWTRTAVFPLPRFTLNRLAALEDQQGFTLNLALIQDIDRQNQRLTLLTRQDDLKNVRAINLGDLELDPQTYKDYPKPFSR
jgi:polynucleotide 5'-hydroxyl-kinase GRC3/NOL9